MLDEALTAASARDALINELYLRRLQEEMAVLSPSSKKFKELSGMKRDIGQEYTKQMRELEDRFPELGVAGGVSSRAIVSDMSLAHRQYYGHKDRRLWDRIFTSSEIIFLNRQSQQLPEARYRLGWTVSVVEAMHGLYDPNFRSLLNKNDLKKLDYGYKAGVEAARQETGGKLVNMEIGVLPGEGDEFEDFPQPKKEA
jgi:hypothetical protein